MLKELEILSQIQELDTKLLEFDKDIKQLPQELQSYKENVAKSKKILEAEKESLKELQVARMKTELELESKLETIKSQEAKLMMIKTNQEYKALEKEIFGFKSDCSVFEDKILENMEQADAVQNAIAEKEKELEKHQNILKTKESEITQRIQEIKQKKKQFDEEKATFVSTVDSSTYKKYMRIFNHHKDNVVVPVIDKTCGGCHMLLTPQAINDVFKNDKIIFCENCARILYWVGEEKP